MKNLRRILFIFLLLAKVSSVQAAEPVAAHSATLAQLPSSTQSAKEQASLMKKKEAIRRVLEARNSPLLGSLDAFMDTCTKYKLDCYLLPSITGLESSFGLYTHPGSYNPFGWGGGYIMFESWDEAIGTVGQGLRENYINRGALTIEQIGSIYAASPTWAARVRLFMTAFEAEEQKIITSLDEFGI
jgi:hypothetical protein